MIVEESNYLAHYGILRKSGRYPWGSGSTQSARNKSFLDTIDELKRQGLTDAQIAKGFSTDEHPFNSTQLRALRAIAVNQQRQSRINQAQRMHDRGWSNVAIGERMGINESSVRSLLKPGAKAQADILLTTSNMLKDQVEKKKYIDVGEGVENSIGLTQTKLKTAVAMLQEEGYVVHYLKVKQLGTGLPTTVKVLTKPGVPWAEVRRNQDQIQQITDFTSDGGGSFVHIRPPTNISAKRVAVVYGKDGGAEKDGLIELRPGVDDLSMGGSRYSQVRIAVDGTHYLKGMAVYNSDLPKGTDVRFNTNKNDTGNKKDAMKKQAVNPDGSINVDSPFGASIKPGGQRGALNIVNEEGDWDTWSRSLPSQMLSKQSPDFAKKQLDITHERRRKDLDEIMSLTNPTVKKRLLEAYSDDVDAAAVHLKAAAIPRQATKVILPISSIKPSEIYAPGFRDGERVALIRFPHGGKFEIPELTVNNRNAQARRILGTVAKDAVGIHSTVAERLSGADFDGDTVLVIPNNKKSVKSQPALAGLKDFDPRTAFPAYPGMIPIDGVGGKKPANKQKEMGKITNLITDMTIRGASNEEIARAVRHSMVVIDAGADKHNLDYRGSANANGIAQLKTKYQKSVAGKAGAVTLISQASAQVHVPDRKPRSAAKGGPIDRTTGAKVFEETGATRTTKTGKVVPKTVKSKRLAETTDAHTLSSGTRIERIYADHSNKLKSLANMARKEMVGVTPTPYSKSAKKAYTKEVDSLNAKLNIALKNRPLERSAQLLATSIVNQKKYANPHLDSDDIKKIENQALVEARIRTGASKQRIDITQSEWDAIQAGAITTNKLSKILRNADLDQVKKFATPKTKLKMTPLKQARARTLLNKGYTLAEVADDLGVSVSTLNVSLA